MDMKALCKWQTLHPVSLLFKNMFKVIYIDKRKFPKIITEQSRGKSQKLNDDKREKKPINPQIVMCRALPSLCSIKFPVI